MGTLDLRLGEVRSRWEPARPVGVLRHSGRLDDRYGDGLCRGWCGDGASDMVGAVAGDGGQARIGKYDLVKHLAPGGMAEIHLARVSGIAGFEKYLVVKRVLPPEPAPSTRRAAAARRFYGQPSWRYSLRSLIVVVIILTLPMVLRSASTHPGPRCPTSTDDYEHPARQAGRCRRAQRAHLPVHGLSRDGPSDRRFQRSHPGRSGDRHVVDAGPGGAAHANHALALPATREPLSLRRLRRSTHQLRAVPCRRRACDRRDTSHRAPSRPHSETRTAHGDPLAAAMIAGLQSGGGQARSSPERQP